MHSAKKIGKNLHFAGISRGFCFAETLRTLGKSVIRTFGKVFAYTCCVRLTCLVVSAHLRGINLERVEDGSSHLNAKRFNHR